MKSNITIIKLISGEQILGKLGTAPTTTQTRLEKAHVMAMSPNGQQFMLMPYVVGAASESVDINNNTIVTTVAANAELAAAFIKQTSGIELPNPANTQGLVLG